MNKSGIKIYGYRWVMLAVFMAAIAVNQLLWITFAPITNDAAVFYGVSDLKIGMLSMCFMLVFIVFSLPASWMIGRFGIRASVGTGAALTGVFGLMRGLTASHYNLVLISQIAIAIGQPFILNAITSVAGRWFPPGERATASGLGSLAIYLGVVCGLSLTPALEARHGMRGMLLLYGIASLSMTVLVFLLTRERPLTPPCSFESHGRPCAFSGAKRDLFRKDFVLLLIIFFIGLGVFNGVTTWIEDIMRPKGIGPAQAGNLGGLMIIGGIAGAFVLPLLSDRLGRRIPFLIAAITGASAGLVGIASFNGVGLLLASSFILGFFLLSAGPIGFQYGAEITFPAPEGTSNGLLLLMGQISGVLFIFGMDFLKSPKTGSMTFPLAILVGLLIVSLLLCIRLKEPSMPAKVRR